jgi:hypothetical protein
MEIRSDLNVTQGSYGGAWAQAEADILTAELVELLQTFVRDQSQPSDDP